MKNAPSLMTRQRRQVRALLGGRADTIGTHTALQRAIALSHVNRLLRRER